MKGFIMSLMWWVGVAAGAGIIKQYTNLRGWNVAVAYTSIALLVAMLIHEHGERKK